MAIRGVGGEDGDESFSKRQPLKASDVMKECSSRTKCGQQKFPRPGPRRRQDSVVVRAVQCSHV